MLPTQQHCQQREREKQKQRQRTEEEGSKSNEESFLLNILLLLSVVYNLASSIIHTLYLSLAVTTVLFHRFTHSSAGMLFPLNKSLHIFSLYQPTAARTAVSQHAFPHIDPRSTHTHTHTSKNTLEHLFLMSHWTCSWMRFCSNKSASWISLIAVVPCYVCGS